MTSTATTAARTAARWITRTAYTIAAIGVGASYTTQVALLHAHGVTGPFAWVLPSTLDLLAIAAAVALQLPNLDRASRRIAASILLLTVAVSVAANLAGGHNAIERAAHAPHAGPGDRGPDHGRAGQPGRVHRLTHPRGRPVGRPLLHAGGTMETYDWREALDAYRVWTQAQRDEDEEHARRQARITRNRAVALAAMASLGMSVREIADEVKDLSPSRVGQLVALVRSEAREPAQTG